MFDASPEYPVPMNEHPVSPSPRSATRVLIVDDDEMLRELYEMFLMAGGFQTETAQNVDEALGLLGMGGFDLVLTDFHMPKLGGADLIRAIRAAGEPVPVIVISGALQSAADLPAELQNEVAGTLPKPITADKMVGAVHRVLAAKHVTAAAA